MTPTNALEIVKCQYERFNKTREVQWKMNVAIWTLIILGIGNIEKMIFHISSCWINCLSIAFGIIHCIYIVRSQRALEASKIINKKIVDEMNKSVDDTANIEVKIEEWTQSVSWPSTAYWWVFLQILSTSILLIIFIIVVNNFLTIH